MYKIIEVGNDQMLVEEPEVPYDNISPLHTYADYLKFKFEERVELYRGILMKMSAPNRYHQSISRELFIPICNVLKKEKCQAYSAPFDVRLPVKNKKRDDQVYTVVQPDIVVICDENILDDKGCCGAPDLVIEILSPGNSKRELRNKFELYEEAGVKEYWIVNPEMQNIIIYSLVANKFIGSRFYTDEDIIKSNILKGLEIDVAEIFKK